MYSGELNCTLPAHFLFKEKSKKELFLCWDSTGNPRMKADSDLLLFIGRSFTSRERATKCVWERVVSSPSDYIMVSSQAELLIQVCLCTLKVLAVFMLSHHDSSKQRSETVTSRETKDTLRWEVSLRIPQMLNIHEALIPSPTPEKREGEGRAHQKSNHLPSLWWDQNRKKNNTPCKLMGEIKTGKKNVSFRLKVLFTIKNKFLLYYVCLTQL